MNSRTLKKHLKYIVPQVRLVLVREPGGTVQPILRPDNMECFVEPMKYYAEEHFVAFFLNARNEITGYSEISKGTVNASLVHPREVFKPAIMANSVSILVAHNHPGGSLKPSPEDLDTTVTLINAGNLLGIKVLDHVIVSSNGLMSLREHYASLWI